MRIMRELLINLEEINALKQALKTRCMIFQVDAKERTAKELGLRFDTFYNFAYKKWSKIGKALAIVHSEAEENWYDTKKRKTIKEFKYMRNPTMGKIWGAYFDYCKRMGKDKRKEILKTFKLKVPKTLDLLTE